MAVSGHILVVEDELTVADHHREIITSAGYRCDVLTDPARLEKTLRDTPSIELVLLDLHLPGRSGLELLREIKASHPQVGVIIITVVSDVGSAVEAIKHGAFNYLLKPIRRESVEPVISAFFSAYGRSVADDPRLARFQTVTAECKRLLSRAKTYAPLEEPVTIFGESGTGKLLVANIMHSLRDSAQGVFHEVDLARFPHALPISASGDITVPVEVSKGGTLCLRHLETLPQGERSKLLSAVLARAQKGGGASRIKFILCVDESSGSVPELDKRLLESVSSYSLRIPPLRERPEDIPLLSRLFLRKYSAQFGKMIGAIHDRAIEILTMYDFPRNVTELEDVISASVLQEPTTTLQEHSLPDHIVRTVTSAASNLEEVRRSHILRTVAAYQGNQTKAAQALGIARGTLNRLIQQFKKDSL